MFPELELLLACGRPPGEGARARISGLLARPIDWPLLAGLAAAHGMLALVSRALPDEACAVCAPIRAKASSVTMRSLRMAAELARILAVMRTRGVTALAFKGPTLSYLAYGDLGMRTFNDLDIFVPRGELDAALDVLAAEGYAKSAPAWDTFSGACEIVLQRRDSRCDVDLHWLFSPPYFLPFDTAGAVERSILLQSNGLTARTLCAEDHLLYLCIHAAREGWAHARFPCDVTGIAFRCALDWDALVRRAEGAGCRRALAAGLELAGALCEAPIPPEILRRGRLDPAVSRISAAARLALETGTPAGARLHLRTLVGWRAKARYLRRRALQPNQKDAEWAHLPRRLSGAYYAVRPLRLAWTALRRWAAHPS